MPHLRLTPPMPRAYQSILLLKTVLRVSCGQAECSELPRLMHPDSVVRLHQPQIDEAFSACQVLLWAL